MKLEIKLQSGQVKDNLCIHPYPLKKATRENLLEFSWIFKSQIPRQSDLVFCILPFISLVENISVSWNLQNKEGCKIQNTSSDVSLHPSKVLRGGKKDLFLFIYFSAALCKPILFLSKKQSQPQIQMINSLEKTTFRSFKSKLHPSHRLECGGKRRQFWV